MLLSHYLTKFVLKHTDGSCIWGVKPEHYGLGNAMAQTIIKNVQRKRSTSIGALIKEGKVTQRYADSKILSNNTYVLLEYNLVR